MFRNYLKLALRNLLRRRTFTLLNLAGLSLGMATCLLIVQYVRYEWQYDRQSPYAANIWRAYNETVTDGKVVTQDANTHAILGPSLASDLPGEVVDFTRLFNHGESRVTFFHQNRPVQVEGAWMADPGFLRMFPQRFLTGKATDALNAPFSMVLTETTAKMLFGEVHKAPGQALRVPGGAFAGNYTVTGVVADPPANTHLKFRALAGYETRHALGHKDNWGDYWEYTYFQLAPGVHPDRVRSQLAHYSATHLKNDGIRLAMQPLTDIHLHSRLTYEIEPNGNAATVQFLALVAAFVLLIAFVNYINLTTARALMRSKEVAVRKVVGARRRQLIAQFLVEGSLLNLCALGIALFVVQQILPVFSDLTDRPLALTPGFDFVYWLTAFALWLCGILAACFYPAVALSSFSPMAAMGRYFSNKTGKGVLRKGLVVFQFSCSTALIVAVLVVWRQLDFLENHDKGMTLDQMVAVKMPEFNWELDSLNQRKMAVLRTEIARLSGVESVAASGIVPSLGISTIGGTSGGIYPVNRPEAATRATVYFVTAEKAFFPTYGIRFLAGQPYDALSEQAAQQNIVINESCRKMLGFADAKAAIGEVIAFQNSADNRMTIHGVVADFHIESLKEPTRPTIYTCPPQVINGYLSMKVAPQQMQAVLAASEGIWRQVFPESTFDYRFLDEQFAAQYRSERQLGTVFGIFALLAIFVACLGLFGLAAFTAEQRTKEIGIRKVLGASVAGIAALLSKDFLKLVCLAILIAAPVAWWLMNKWLADFACRINLQWWMPALAGLVAIGIATLTVSFQSIRAALANPVKSLRSE